MTFGSAGDIPSPKSVPGGVNKHIRRPSSQCYETKLEAEWQEFAVDPRMSNKINERFQSMNSS